jgi:SAM-dependent methyltransferase
MSAAPSIDDPERADLLRRRIQGKGFLRRFYAEVYARYAESLSRCPSEGGAVELGSGMGFVREHLPGILKTDVLPYPGLNAVMDGTRMPFADESLRFIAMLDVFHHIPDVGAFLAEAERCLRPGGRLFIVDQYPGWISTPLYKYVHTEPYRPDSREWRFDTTGPLSGANGALAWIVFRRDLKVFQSRYPNLRVTMYRPHSPIRYWISGGLKWWTLVPAGAFPLATRIDRMISGISERWSSFVDIEVIKEIK